MKNTGRDKDVMHMSSDEDEIDDLTREKDEEKHEILKQTEKLSKIRAQADKN